jgi:DNA repair protein RadD
MTNQTINLRYYQQEAIDTALSNKNGILVLPTGTGKSLVIAGICKQIKEPILILQPSKEILEQNFEKIKAFTNEDIGIYSASKKRKDIHRITLATIGSIKDLELFREFKILLVDEAHLVRSDAGKYCEFIEEMGFTKIIGLTATPYRLKSWRGGFSWSFLHRTRPKIFEKIIYIYQIKKAFEDGFLSPISYFKYEYDLTQIKEAKLDYQEQSVVEYNIKINIYETIINIVKNNNNRKHFLIFANTIDEAGYICELLLRQGINGYCISSNNSKKEREEILSDFKNGKVSFVVNVGILTTGFDFPALDCIILVRPTKSLALFYQMVGRGVRPFYNKTNCEIYDLCGNWGTFGNLMTYEIEGEGAQTGLKNSNGWLIKPHIKKAFKKGEWQIPFGKYKGIAINEVPTNYLQYCLDNFENFFYKEQFLKALEIRKNNLT